MLFGVGSPIYTTVKMFDSNNLGEYVIVENQKIVIKSVMYCYKNKYIIILKYIYDKKQYKNLTST